jgi:KipI family sensor histidine kinase inhibitor
VTLPRVLTAGEAALSIEFGNAINPELNARARALDRELAENLFPGFVEAVPSYRSLLVLFDPLECAPAEVATHLLDLAVRTSELRLSPALPKKVPMVYDGEDLDGVAAHTGLSREDVVRLHSGSEVMVYMLGFSPGFAYMGLLPEILHTPRQTTPRTRVLPGTVAVAGRQTGVYPSSTPSGWNLIGRTSISLFDPGSDPPTFFLPGDRVRFVPVTELEDPSAGRDEPAEPKGEPTFEVIKRRAPQTLVQDLGRVGYQRYGVPVSGAVDTPALRAANLLVGNTAGAAALECTIAGPVILRALRNAVVSITGADLGAVLDSEGEPRRPVPLWSSTHVHRGDVLRFTKRNVGARAYLAVAGGLDVPRVLGSRATYITSALGGYQGRSLQPGDILRVLPSAETISTERQWPEEFVPTYAQEVSLRILFGPQDDYFTEKGRQTLLSSSYEMASSSDRMGCRLAGPRLEHGKANEIVSDGMMLGGVQVPPDGQPIVMLADRATAGGYPKIATVVGADIPKLGQLMPGARVCFEAVRVEEAVDALRRARRDEEAAAQKSGL